MIKVGVIGFGYWGPNLCRNFSDSDSFSLRAISDLKPENLAKAKRRFPDCKLFKDAKELVESSDIDAVAISTPVHTHFELARLALEAGKHVLVEKPLASTTIQARELTDLAKSRGLTLMVDHTFIYTAAVRKIGELLKTGDLGTFHYYDSVRINLGIFQSDVNVLWDLAVHDLAIMDFLIAERPVAVSAVGAIHLRGGQINTGFLSVFYDSGAIAHINVNWLAPVKVRQTLIGFSKKMIVYDDIEPSEKVKVYDRGLHTESNTETKQQLLTGYRMGDAWSPHLSGTEALQKVVAEFANSIKTGDHPTSDGEMGTRIVELLEQASRSLELRGQCLPLKFGKST